MTNNKEKKEEDIVAPLLLLQYATTAPVSRSTRRDPGELPPYVYPDNGKTREQDKKHLTRVVKHNTKPRAYMIWDERISEATKKFLKGPYLYYAEMTTAMHAEIRRANKCAKKRQRKKWKKTL